MSKIKYIAVLVFAIFSAVNVIGQSVYGNEWINLDQDYYKISVVETGIYKLDKSYFDDKGIDLSSVDPRSFQLFRRGEEGKQQ